MKEKKLSDTEFIEFDKKIDGLYMNNKYQEAINRLDSAMSRFPEHRFEMYYYKLLCHRSLGNFKTCLDMIEAGNRDGYYLDISWEKWDPLRSLDGYEKINKQNLALRAKAQEKAKMIYTVHLPEGYSEQTQHPLFIVLHGDGNCCNIDYFQKEWKPDAMLKRGMIVVYIQSSHVHCPGGFGWTNDYPRARQDIQSCYRDIIRDYSVDTRRVICGGFSGGSMTSINVMMNKTIPLKGIIALCPEKTDDVTPENIRKASEQKIKAVILKGENSETDPWQTSFMEDLQENGVNYIFIENKNIGHELPENFDPALNNAMDFIFDK